MTREERLRTFWITVWSIACGFGLSGVLKADLSPAQNAFGIAGMLALWAIGIVFGALA